MRSFLLISATTHTHFDKLVANKTYICGKYNLHRWQIQSMGWERTRRVPSCQTWQSKAKPAQHSNFQRRQAPCHSQLWKTTPGNMPLWKATPGTMPLWKTMHCSWQLGTLHCRWAYYCDPISKAWCTQSVRGISLYVHIQHYLYLGNLPCLYL